MPTTNPVPSQDPSDLLFNAGKLDEVLNGTGTSFTDRLGTARRTVAGMNADFDTQLADAESDLNVYRADAAASAAEALGYLQTIRATSYGAYASDPATDPLGNPPTVGDEYFNTTVNLLKRWNGTTWQASDINTANLAAPSGSSLVGYDTGTVQDVLDGAKSLQDYAALRAYTGRATRIYITGLLVTAKPAGIAGLFQYDPTDTTSLDNGGTIIVGADGRRWKRDFSGAVNVKWFGAKGDGLADDIESIKAARNYCWTQYKRVFPAGVGLTFPAQSVELEFPDGIYRITSTLDIANGVYEVINYKGLGTATILWDGGGSVAVRAIATTSQGIVTTPISWENICIRKSGTQKEAGSIAFQCERYSNFSVKGMGILGFDIGVLNQGAIDMMFDFNNRAIERCNIGFLTEQKTVAAGIMKPNLLTIKNAYFIQCSKRSVWARRNPLEGAINNGSGSVILIEGTNFQGDSDVAVDCEYLGEVPEFGNITIRDSWFEGAGKRLLRLNKGRATLDNTFLYPSLAGGYPILIETSGPAPRGRITLINCDAFVYESQASNTFIHGFTNTDANTVTDSYLNDVVSTASVRDYVTNINTAIKAGQGVTHSLYRGQTAGEGDYPRFVTRMSTVKANIVFHDSGATASLAGPGGTATIFDMGSGTACYQVTAVQSDGGIVWRASAEVFHNGAGGTSVTTKSSSNVSVTTSGTNIILTNTGSSAQTLNWVIQRIL